MALGHYTPTYFALEGCTGVSGIKGTALHCAGRFLLMLVRPVLPLGKIGAFPEFQLKTPGVPVGSNHWSGLGVLKSPRSGNCSEVSVGLGCLKAQRVVTTRKLQ